MVLTAYSVLSPVIGFVATVFGVMRKHHRQRERQRQDHTASPSAAASFVFRSSSRPSHPAPNVRDDRETPLLWVRDGDGCRSDLGKK
jgi:hypothetical protein